MICCKFTWTSLLRYVLSATRPVFVIEYKLPPRMSYHIFSLLPKFESSRYKPNLSPILVIHKSQWKEVIPHIGMAYSYFAWQKRGHFYLFVIPLGVCTSASNNSLFITTPDFITSGTWEAFTKMRSGMTIKTYEIINCWI